MQSKRYQRSVKVVIELLMSRTTEDGCSSDESGLEDGNRHLATVAVTFNFGRRTISSVMLGFSFLGVHCDLVRGEWRAKVITHPGATSFLWLIRRFLRA